MGRFAAATAAGSAAALAASLAIACNHNGGGATLAPAGATTGSADDGSGWLARASVKYMTSSDEGGFEPEPSEQPITYDYYNGYTYGGFSQGGDGYGGSVYAGFQPYVAPTTPNRTVDYAVSYTTDNGSIVGTVTWPKAPHVPATLGDGCTNSSLRLGRGGTVEGAVVYLEKITTGRQWMFGPKPIGVGGTAEIEGCSIVPTVQVLGPIPDELLVANSGDVPDTIVVQRDGDATTSTETTLETGRSAPVPVTATGVFQVGDKAGKLTPGWVIVAAHPYYALSDDHGRFRLDDVVPGDYELVVWQPPVITGVVDGVMKFGAPVVTKKKVTVKKLAETRADLALP